MLVLAHIIKRLSLANADRGWLLWMIQKMASACWLDGKRSSWERLWHEQPSVPGAPNSLVFVQLVGWRWDFGLLCKHSLALCRSFTLESHCAGCDEAAGEETECCWWFSSGGRSGRSRFVWHHWGGEVSLGF